MITSFLPIRKMWIFSLQTQPPMPLGKIIDIVVEPKKGEIKAVWVQTLDGLRLVDFADIQRLTKKEAYISHQHDLCTPESLPKLRHTLENEVRIISADVFVKESEKNRKIGMVVDFVFDTTILRISAIVVQKRGWFWGEKIEIPRVRILEINEDGVFVSNNEILVTEKKGDPSIVPSLD